MPSCEMTSSPLRLRLNLFALLHVPQGFEGLSFFLDRLGTWLCNLGADVLASSVQHFSVPLGQLGRGRFHAYYLLLNLEPDRAGSRHRWLLCAAICCCSQNRR